MDNEKVQLLNALNQQHEVINEQLQLVEQQINELMVFNEELDTLKTQKNTEILAPIGKSVFAVMKINTDQKFYVDVGAGYFVRKTIDETKKVADGQKARLDSFRLQLSDEIKNITVSLEEMIIESQNS